MDGRYRKSLYLNDQYDPEYSPENSEEFSRATTVSTSNNSPKRRRVGQKRVLSVPIKDTEGSRLKGETPPPSDSWAWRKYGQKPIKGSPYPRGYYRCSSSKGCPARKQVERSRVDPTMLVVTYSAEHNHPQPLSKNNEGNNNNNKNNDIIEKVTDDSVTATAIAPAELNSVSSNLTISNSEDDVVVFENQFASMAEEFPLSTYEFKWFSDLNTTSSTTLFESPVIDGGDGPTIFPMGEEDESLFADLEELPECSVVFRRGVLEDSRRCNLAPWCG